MVNSMLKNIHRNFCGMHGMSQQAYKEEKKGQILYIAGRDNHITTITKLLDITHKSYRFNADLIESIN